MSSVRHGQFATFYLDDRLYGINVTEVQEVADAMPMSVVRLAPTYIRGLINLRGQISAAVCLRDLFQIGGAAGGGIKTVVCRSDGNLLSFIVDRIGDVVEVSSESFEPTPDTVPGEIARFMGGVYKTERAILSVISVGKIAGELMRKDRQAG